jgi:hypothetical protein
MSVATCIAKILYERDTRDRSRYVENKLPALKVRTQAHGYARRALSSALAKKRKSHAFFFSRDRRGRTPDRSLEYGAGDGNRTHVSSLGSYSSTIELHPRRQEAP